MDDRGFALVLAVWAVTLLAALAAALGGETRAAALATRGHVGGAVAEALADAGVHAALFDLGRGAASPRVRRIDLGAGAALVRIDDEYGRIDLNAAPEAVLRALFRHAGLAAAAASAMAARLADYRDGDSLRRNGGAEADDYRAAGLAPPKDGPLAQPDEAAGVLGMTPDLLAAVAPYVTVFTGAERVVADAAPPAVAAAMAAIVADAGARTWASRPAAARALYRIRSEGRLPDGTRFVREAVAAVAADRRPALLLWRRADGGDT
ncbi:general secretion pathway protein GspK [Azospirillum sp. ST 5-10]|uniref:general secretion pathway protein GspK n=1 Tax=unclassified Azospirillum TaxID=2630922 RepID=UPI003F49D685